MADYSAGEVALARQSISLCIALCAARFGGDAKWDEEYVRDAVLYAFGNSVPLWYIADQAQRAPDLRTFDTMLYCYEAIKGAK
jgi:hypothetical protein